MYKCVLVLYTLVGMYQTTVHQNTLPNMLRRSVHMYACARTIALYTHALM